MAIDLTNLVSQVLTPQIVMRIATALGIDPALAQKLIDAALPTVLASLGSIASEPAGAQKIADAVSNQDSDILGKLTGGIGGADHAQLVAGGSQLLGSLVGSQALGTLTQTLGKFAGADPKVIGSVLGLVTPAVLGTLGQQDPENWSDANAVSKLFKSQEGAIAAAAPAGLQGALQATGLAKSAAGNVTAAAQAGVNASGAASATSGGVPVWVWGLVAVVIVAAIAWYFLIRPHAG